MPTLKTITGEESAAVTLSAIVGEESRAVSRGQDLVQRQPLFLHKAHQSFGLANRDVPRPGRAVTAVVVGESVFMHGGLLAEHVDYGLERMNREVREEF